MELTHFGKQIHIFHKDINARKGPQKLHLYKAYILKLFKLLHYKVNL